MDLTPDLYSKVIQYINGELSRSRLEDWLVPHLEELLSPGSPGSHELVGELELDLAELNHGDITEEELRTSLGEFLQNRAIFTLLIESPADANITVKSAIATPPRITPTVSFPWQSHDEPVSISAVSETQVREVVFSGTQPLRGSS